jgi:dTDP-4-dehydrorhamnose reductase
MKNYLIFGSNGALGQNLTFRLSKRGNVVAISRADLDVMNKQKLREFLSLHEDFIVINCIAFMPADKCETMPQESKSINLDFVRNLAEVISISRSQKLIHFSSDFIFDGETNFPYKEDGIPKPLNVYGYHKHESEKVVLEILGDRCRVLRISSLVASTTQKKTFIEKIIINGREQKELSLVSDLVISISTADLVALTIENAFRIQKEILHAVHVGQTSWHELAQCAFSFLGITTKTIPVVAATFGSPAKRPIYSALAPSVEVTDLDPRTWKEALEKFVKSELSI